MTQAFLQQAQDNFRSGHVREAESILLRGRTLYPRDPGLAAGLGRLYMQQGQLPQAAAAFQDAVLLAPDNADFRHLLVRSYQTVRFTGFIPQAKQAMLACLRDPALPHAAMAQAWLSLLFFDPQCAPLVSLFIYEDYDDFARAMTADGLIRDEFFLLGLRRFLIASPAVERGLTFLRRWFFEHPEEVESRISLVCALAHYCFLTEYAFTTVEDFSVLRDRVASPGTAALLGCYEPLFLHARASSFHALSQDGDFQGLLRTQVDEPSREKELRESIPALCAIDNAVSGAVRAQYEENPYPRWATVAAPVLPEAVTEKARGKKILIAGCGTGREAAEQALLFPQASVTAVDLSRASLAYGMRRCGEMGIDNIRFAQGDILGLPQTGKAFDLIVCSGVLHHMEDPVAGWKALLSVMAPGGVMRVALYSTIARAAVREARAVIAERGYEATADGIRAFRAEIMARDDADPMRKILTGSSNFYSLSQCRDLVFHVQEHTFTLPEIAGIRDRLGLALVRMDLRHPRILPQYRAQFPDDPAGQNFDNWHIFEQQNPGTFAGMYGMMFCRKTDVSTLDIDWIRAAAPQ